MATLGTIYTRNLNKEPLSFITPEKRDAGDIPKSPASKQLCGTCGNIDFAQLFRSRTKKSMGPIRQAFRNWWCPLCSLIIDHLAKANPHLDVHNDVFESSLNYFIRFYQKLPEGHIYYRTLVIGLESSSVTRYGSDQWFAPITFDLVGDIHNPKTGRIDVSGIRRPLKSALDVGELRRWLETCDTGHLPAHLERTSSEKDIHAEFEYLQQAGHFRLIDVNTKKVVTIRQTPRYFALSYVWGKTMMTYSASHLLSVDELNNIPRTIEDAMLLVQRLGERYLWVDTMCIDQTNIEERQEVVAHMSSIYRNAYATIVAAHGDDSNTGLTPLHAQSGRLEKPIRMQGQNISFKLLPSRPQVDELLERCTWSSRAWTFQERLLSKRSIFLFGDEVVLQCAGAVLREAYDLDHGKGRNPQSFSPVGVFQRSMDLIPFEWSHYCSAVSDYSRRNMTNSGDRLDAFRGIFDRFCTRSQNKDFHSMLCALPFEWFGLALLWTVPTGHKYPQRNLMSAVGSRRLPSWSWVGWNGLVAHTAAEMPEPPHVSMKLWTLEQIGSNDLVLRRKDDPSPDISKPHDTPTDSQPPPCTTLHISAPVLPCFIESSAWDVTNMACLMAKDQSTGSSVEVGTVHIDDPFWLVHQDEGKLYSLVLFLDSSSFLNNLVPALLIDQVGQFAERVPVAVNVTASFAVLSQYSKKEYVHLQ